MSRYCCCVVDSAILSPMDSGAWLKLCGRAWDSSWNRWVRSLGLDWSDTCNCSAVKYPASLGTARDFRHTLLANLRFWSSHVPNGLATLVSRWQTRPWGMHTMSGWQSVSYVEALIPGRIEMPRAARLLSASLPSLFGTPRGAALRLWCATHGVVLVWNHGLREASSGDEAGASFTHAAIRVAGGADYFSWQANHALRAVRFHANGRILDPAVLASTSASHNLSSLATRLRAPFEALWNATAAGRGAGGVASHKLDLESLMVEPLGPGSCTDGSRCVGVLISDGSCVCYGASSTQDGTQ